MFECSAFFPDWIHLYTSLFSVFFCCLFESNEIKHRNNYINRMMAFSTTNGIEMCEIEMENGKKMIFIKKVKTSKQICKCAITAHIVVAFNFCSFCWFVAVSHSHRFSRETSIILLIFCCCCFAFLNSYLTVVLLFVVAVMIVALVHTESRNYIPCEVRTNKKRRAAFGYRCYCSSTLCH